MDMIVRAENVRVKIEGEELLHGLSFDMPEGVLLAVVGASGCGKTILGRLVAGMIKHSLGVFQVKEGVKSVFIEQQDNFFAQTDMRNTYYSQRYEFFEERAVPTVADLLKIDIDNWQEDKVTAGIVSTMNIAGLLDRQLLLLSNGERKRVQIASALMQGADLYVFDQPFLGLDVHSRTILRGLLLRLKDLNKTVMLICNKKEIPDCCNQVMELRKGCIAEYKTYKEFANTLCKEEEVVVSLENLQLPMEAKSQLFGDVVRMKDVTVTSGDKVILQGINWTVRDHEKWLLAGHNGSGKSTLLSLVTADNPQGYTNDLVLFGKQRGSGETVWEIKENIGFVSPELHLYFLRQNKLTGFNTVTQQSIDCLSVVVSGFSGEIGSVSSSSNMVQQQHIAKEWLHSLGLIHLLGKQFAEVSLGEQRMLLLIRALIKNPPLLILDEPCQGIDYEQSQRFIKLLDVICAKLNTTLIYVTHSVDEIPACISHKIELEQGSIKYCGVFEI